MAKSETIISFYDVFGELWAKKWLIFLVVVLSALCGHLLQQAQPKSYDVNLAFQINLVSPNSILKCQNDIKYHRCLKKGVLSKFKEVLTGGAWVLDADQMIIKNTTETPLTEDQYRAKFDELNAKLTPLINDEAVRVLRIVNSAPLRGQRQSEIIASLKYSAVDVIDFVDENKYALSITSTSIAARPQFIAQFLTLIGLGFVLFLTVIRFALSRKARHELPNKG